MNKKKRSWPMKSSILISFTFVTLITTMKVYAFGDLANTDQININRMNTSQSNTNQAKENQNNNIVNITIYNENATGLSPEFYSPGANLSYQNTNIPGFAVIRIQKPFELIDGLNSVTFTDVAPLIDPTTVIVKALTYPLGTKVIEQNYRFDMTNLENLLERYLWKEITVEQMNGDKIESYTGKLLSSNNSLGVNLRLNSEMNSGINCGSNSNLCSGNGLILQNKENKIISINHYSNILFPELPEGLITKPSLVWSIVAEKKGMQTLEVSYQTRGMIWWTDYNAILEENPKEKNKQTSFLDMNAWVSIINKSGTSFENANIKLMSGQVNRSRTSNNIMPMAASLNKVGFVTGGTAGLTETPFSEYHLYTFDRKINLPVNSTKQVEFFSKISKIPVEIQYEYLGAQQQFYGSPILNRDSTESESTKLETYLKFKNDKIAGLGNPLPAGRIRISKINTEDGTMEFIGEDSIKPTAKDEVIRLKLGSAFDVMGKRTQTNLTLDEKRHILEETIEIEIKNHKSNDVNILIKENMYRTLDWKIENISASFDKLNSQTIQIPLTVKKDGDAKVQYTVRYTW